MKATKETHYEKEVWVNPSTESLRRKECLCLNCDNMKPGEDNCHIANSLYQICKSENVAMAITRCPLWKPKSDQPIFYVVEYHGDGGQACAPARRTFTDQQKSENFADTMKVEPGHTCGPNSVKELISTEDLGDEGY